MMMMMMTTTTKIMMIFDDRIYHGYLPSSASIWGAAANSMLSFATCWSFSCSRRPSYVLSTWDIVIIFSSWTKSLSSSSFGIWVTFPQILHSYVLRSPMVVCVGWPENFKLGDHLQICKYLSLWANTKIWNWTRNVWWRLKECEPRPRPLPRSLGCAYFPKFGQCFFSCFRRP